jgi:hypothetical protein
LQPKCPQSQVVVDHHPHARHPPAAGRGDGQRLLAPERAAGTARVKTAKSIAVCMGNWPTLRRAQALPNAPDITTLKGLRARAIIAPCRTAREYAGRVRMVPAMYLLLSAPGTRFARLAADPRPHRVRRLRARRCGGTPGRAIARLAGRLRPSGRCPPMQPRHGVCRLRVGIPAKWPRAGTPG